MEFRPRHWWCGSTLHIDTLGVLKLHRNPNFAAPKPQINQLVSTFYFGTKSASPGCERLSATVLSPWANGDDPAVRGNELCEPS